MTKRRTILNHTITYQYRRGMNANKFVVFAKTQPDMTFK